MQKNQKFLNSSYLSNIFSRFIFVVLRYHGLSRRVCLKKPRPIATLASRCNGAFGISSAAVLFVFMRVEKTLKFQAGGRRVAETRGGCSSCVVGSASGRKSRLVFVNL